MVHRDTQDDAEINVLKMTEDIKTMEEVAAPSFNFLTETQKSKQKLSESMLSELLETAKGYRNEASVESRKRQLENDRKGFWHFYLPLPQPSPQSSTSPKVEVILKWHQPEFLV